MPEGYRESKPFSNGSDYMFFEESFCERCTKNGKCPTQKMVGEAYIDRERWRGNMEIRDDGKHHHACLDFFGKEASVQSAYEEVLPQKYAGYTLHNTRSGYYATDDNGVTVMTCGNKEKMESYLLIIAGDSKR